ncbi:MAG TPA: Wzz/FepE/Etk N-terminal domain-containing protein [Ignavibacteria bacterium]|nr:Wzz/FepE/Etk N-terminal domain-containing protein [Ignavibacteria bacterium]
MDLIHFIKVLLRRKLLLIVLPSIAVIITYLLVKNLPDVYKSSAQLSTGITDETKLSLTTEGQAIQQFDIQNKFGNLIELMNSKKVVDLVGYKLLRHDLTSSPPFREPSKLMQTLNQEAKNNVIRILNEKIDSMASLTNAIEDERGIIALLESMKYDYSALYNKLKINREGTSDFIKIEFESENPDLSAYVVNEEVTEFIRYYKQLTAVKSDATINFFADLSEQKKKELDEKVDELKRYKMANGVINLYEQTKSLVDQKAELEIAREEENKKIPALQEAIKLINNKFTNKDKLYYEANSRTYNARIVELKDKIKRLTDDLITQGYTNQALKDEIEATKKQLEVEIVSGADDFLLDPNTSKNELVTRRIGYEVDLEIARYSTKSMDKELARLDAQVQSYAPKEAEIAAYEREIQVASDVYLMVLNRLNLSRFDTMNLGNSLKQTEYGEPANKPEASKKMLTVILAGVVSLLMTVILIFVIEYLDQTIKSPAHFLKLTNIELLGTLNRLKKSQINLRELFSDRELDGDSELFKQLLRSLRFEILKKLNGKRIILVTSTEKGAGKSLIISCLAYSLALINKRVLLIDTNFSHPSLTSSFNASPVFEEYLEETLPADKVISRTTMGNIDIAGSKGGSYSPDEIGGIDNLNKKIHELAKGYDIVFMEGAALNKYSDSKELSNISDAVISVFSANNVIEESDKNSIEILNSMDPKFIGAILNNLSTEYIEEIYGDFYKKRSWARRVTKSIIKRNLSKKKLKDTSVS